MADLLGIGKSGLNVSKKALEVTGHNLSNVNTEGFSRQRVMQSTAIPVSVGGFVQGTGAKVDGVRRFNDEFVDKRLRGRCSGTSAFVCFQLRIQTLFQVARKHYQYSFLDKERSDP